MFKVTLFNYVKFTSQIKVYSNVCSFYSQLVTYQIISIRVIAFVY